MFTYYRLFLFSIFIAFAGASGISSAQTKWDLPTGYPLGNFMTVNLVQFVEDIEKGTGGQLKITMHPNASLYKVGEIKRAVQTGQVQIGEVGLFMSSNEWPIYEADNLPFLASSYDGAMKLYQVSKPLFEKRLASQGMVLLYSVPWPGQGLYSKKQLNSIADLKGLKWRAYSPSTARIAELVGAQPVTIQTPELSQAMAAGMVDTFITSSQTGVDTKSFEYMKYFYNLQAWLPRNEVLVNKKAFDALDPALQRVIRKAAADAEVRGWKAAKEIDAKSIATLEANGMKIVTPSDSLKAEFEKIGDVLAKEWLVKAGSEGRALVDAYKKP